VTSSNKHNTKSFSWTGVSHDDELNRKNLLTS
jgi:hypothetical protein